jgi:hypothetical protein
MMIDRMESMNVMIFVTGLDFFPLSLCLSRDPTLLFSVKRCYRRIPLSHNQDQKNDAFPSCGAF